MADLAFAEHLAEIVIRGAGRPGGGIDGLGTFYPTHAGFASNRRRRASSWLTDANIWRRSHNFTTTCRRAGSGPWMDVRRLLPGETGRAP